MVTSDPLGRELDVLEEGMRRLSSAETEQEVCDIVTDTIPSLFGTDFGGIWFYDAEARTLEPTAATDRATERTEFDVTFDPDQTHVWQPFESGTVQTRPRTGCDAPPSDSAAVLASELVVPFGTYGVAVVASPDPAAFGGRTVQLAQILSTGIESALTRTEREHELRLKKDRLEEFIELVTHDLRNPLGVSNGYLDMVRDDVDDPRLGKVSEGLDRIETLTDDLLTLSEQGRIIDTRSAVELDAVATEAWENLYTPEATLHIVDSIELFGDRHRLLHVFENLFRNSVEHGSTTPRSQAREDSVEHGSTGSRPQAGDSVEHGDDVTIRVGVIQSVYPSTRVAAADHVTGFFVADDGQGIPADEQPEIFDAGWSTDGTGLGLAIVKRVVEAHGWQISVKDRIGGGTRFEVVSGTKPVAPFTHS